MDSLLKKAQAAFQWGYGQLKGLTGVAASSLDQSRLQEAFTTISRGESLGKEFLNEIALDLRRAALAPDQMSWPSMKSVPNAAQVQVDNRCACLPLLKQAVESQEQGSAEAGLEYERRRLTHIDFLPSYARTLCEHTCQQECAKVKIKVPTAFPNKHQAEQEVSKFLRVKIAGTGFDECGQPRPGPLNLSGFTGSLSYESSRLLLESLSPEKRRDEFSFVTHCGETSIPDRFSPASDGPLGTAAAAAWQQMAKIALASVVLEDLLSGLPFQISPDIKSEAISKAIAGKASRWAIADSRVVENARELLELYDAGKISDKALAVAIKSRDAMFSQSIERVVGDIEHAQASKANKVSAIHASGKVAQNATVRPSEAESHIGNPKWEFYAAIHSARPDEPFDNAFRQQHSALYRIYRTTEISLQDCVDLVRKGGDAEARFVSEMKEQQLSMPPRPEQTASIAEGGVSKQAHADETLESSIEEPYTIEGHQALLTSEWFQGLDATYQNLLEKRLERVMRGNFGDWRRLEGVSACELRFHRGTGQRVYFRFTGPNSIELLDAGPKSEQDRILSRLR
jgi:putative addiction module killer protein